jgi:putative transposase
MLTDGYGIPIAVAVDGANAHDQTLVRETLSGIPVQRPRPTQRKRQHLCADKGYDANAVRTAAKRRRYIHHIPRKNNTAPQTQHRHGKARRWVVERTHSWINRARRLLTRWEKKVENYLGFLHLQFAVVTLRCAGVLG